MCLAILGWYLVANQPPLPPPLQCVSLTKTKCAKRVCDIVGCYRRRSSVVVQLLLSVNGDTLDNDNSAVTNKHTLDTPCQSGLCSPIVPRGFYLLKHAKKQNNHIHRLQDVLSLAEIGCKLCHYC